MSDEFEIIAEWVIRKLKDIDLSSADLTEIIRWVLYSLGVKDLGIDIYLYLRSVGRATSTEIAERFKISPTTARRYLEQLHTLGLVDYIGREYHLTRKNIASCIRDILIPRIKSILEDIAKVAESVSKEERIEKTMLSKEDIDRLVLAPVRREIDKTLREAKREALKEIEKLFSTAGKIGPEIIYNTLSRIFDTLSESLRRLGERAYNIGTLKIEPTPQVRGLSIVETPDLIKYTVYSDYRLQAHQLRYAKEKGKRVIIRVFGTLYIDKDVTLDLADIIEEVYVYGEVIGPREVLEFLSDRIRGPGNIRYY